MDFVDEVVGVLEGGGTVVLPTDTVYGLAALPGDPAAIDKLFTLKGRREHAPLAVLCAGAPSALALADVDDRPSVSAVVARWWPGPLTLVLPRRDGLDLHLGEPTTTIGLRVPAHDLLRGIAARVGPIATTSANRHGEPPATTAEEAARVLGAGVDLVVDGGRLEGSASTVIDATSWPWVVLRDGSIDSAEVLATARGAAR